MISVPEIPESFHFLRPEWLLALLPAVLLAAMAFRRMGQGGNAWARLVDAHLLRHLALAEKRASGRWPIAALLAGWVLASLAMAGPTWEKLPTPTFDRTDPTVVVLSLTQAMNATDQTPTRLGAARHKVEDILRRMRGGEVGLLLFADRPFVASPLTEDGRVVSQMLPDLATDLMPVQDNRPDGAITRAVEMLEAAGAPTGRILLMTEGLGDEPDATIAAAAAAARSGYQVSVIGLGTEAGSPLRLPDGTQWPAAGGTTPITRLDAAGLRKVAEAGKGAFSPLTTDDSDLDRVLRPSALRTGDLLQQNGLTADTWADMGPYLLLAVLLLAPFAFRRGWIAMALLAALPALGPREASAAEPFSAQGWRDLWQTPDQQGAEAFAQKDYDSASQSFQDPAWRGSALYRAGQYDAAAEAFGAAREYYNQGNALTRAGRLDEAEKAYDAAIEADPTNMDAINNSKIVRDEIGRRMKKGDGPPPNDPDKDNPDQGDDEAKHKDGPPSNLPGKPAKEDDKAADTAPGKADPTKVDPSKAKPAKTPPEDATPTTANLPKGGAKARQPISSTGAQTSPPPTDPGNPSTVTPLQPPQQQAVPPPSPEAMAAAASKAEQDQSREQMLRMVPDAPGTLLRARIRAQYFGGATPSGPRPSPP